MAEPNLSAPHCNDPPYCWHSIKFKYRLIVVGFHMAYMNFYSGEQCVSRVGICCVSCLLGASHWSDETRLAEQLRAANLCVVAHEPKLAAVISIIGSISSIHAMHIKLAGPLRADRTLSVRPSCATVCDLPFSRQTRGILYPAATLLTRGSHKKALEYHSSNGP